MFHVSEFLIVGCWLLATGGRKVKKSKVQIPLAFKVSEYLRKP
jgi:hypothetical protein